MQRHRKRETRLRRQVAGGTFEVEVSVMMERLAAPLDDRLKLAGIVAAAREHIMRIGERGQTACKRRLKILRIASNRLLSERLHDGERVADPVLKLPIEKIGTLLGDQQIAKRLPERLSDGNKQQAGQEEQRDHSRRLNVRTGPHGLTEEDDVHNSG